ncbi:T9SS type A sorting domain-containing protein [Flavobacterium sp. JP2137]|uniref:T9SS type A sorting domain-containing protein n=1 Tax=Flavobacterium sp. JP2137 TaxID=3414510 RepID=UPI003D2FE409
MKGLMILLLGSSTAFAQCPCIRTAVIGTSTAAPTYNNQVVAMDDVAVIKGEGIQLHTLKSRGSVTWYSRGKPLVNTLVYPTTTTKYTVKSTLEGCPDAFDMVVVSVREVEASQTLVVFPNPTDRYLTVVSDNKGIKGIRLYDVQMRSVLEYVYRDRLKQQVIDLKHLSAGWYVLHIRLADGSSTIKKIIKL